MNRRELIKNAALMGAATLIPSSLKANTQTGTSAPIAELFNQFNTTEYNWVPYPIDIVAPHMEPKRGTCIKNIGLPPLPNRTIDGDYVEVPLFDMEKPTQEELQCSINEEALKIILASAYDRSMIVFDSKKKGDYTRARSLSSVVMRRNGGNRRITHIIQTSSSRPRYSSTTDPFIIEIDRNYFINLVNDMGFDSILTQENLQGYNWGIAVDNSRYELVMPIYSGASRKNGLWHTRCGFASLNNESVLLFNYN